METLPLFPLGTVLYPAGRLPLQIFEVRYLDLIGRCHREGTPFGVVGLRQGSETERPGGDGASREVLQAVGTMARIERFEAPMPGLMRIDCQGGERFRIEQAEQLPHGLWMARITRMAADPVVAIPEDLQPAADKLGQIIRALQSRGLAPDELPIAAPFELEDCGWVANRWSEILPIPSEVKQNLLALDNPVVRLELISDLLDRTRLSF
jgi:Lon protease-like protein